MHFLIINIYTKLKSFFMKQSLFFIAFFFIVSYQSLALDPKPGTTYVFNYIESVAPSDGLGTTTGGANVTVPAGARFEVVHVTANGDVVIAFKEWLSQANKQLYNYTYSGATKTGRLYFCYLKIPLTVVALNMYIYHLGI